MSYIKYLNLKFSTIKLSLFIKFLILILFTSCNKHINKSNLLVCSTYLLSEDSIKKYTPYRMEVSNEHIYYTNLPNKIRNKDWDATYNKYKQDEIIYIDSIGTKQFVKRQLHKKITFSSKKEKINIKYLTRILSINKIYKNDYEILKSKTNKLGNLLVRLRYKGTINNIVLSKNFIIVRTHIHSQEKHWNYHKTIKISK